MVNVLWGLFNLAVVYLLIVRVGRFDLRRWQHVIPLAIGFVLMAIQLADHFSRFHGGKL